MATRGRPKKNDVASIWELERLASVLSTFTEERKKGEKYEEALQTTVNTVKSKYPDKRISITTVKRILAQWYGTNGKEVLIVTAMQAASAVPQSSSPNQPKAPKLTYGLGVGPRPEYLRANRKKK